MVSLAGQPDAVHLVPQSWLRDGNSNQTANLVIFHLSNYSFLNKYACINSLVNCNKLSYLPILLDKMN